MCLNIETWSSLRDLSATVWTKSGKTNKIYALVQRLWSRIVVLILKKSQEAHKGQVLINGPIETLIDVEPKIKAQETGLRCTQSLFQEHRMWGGIHPGRDTKWDIHIHTLSHTHEETWECPRELRIEGLRDLRLRDPEIVRRQHWLPNMLLPIMLFLWIIDIN